MLFKELCDLRFCLLALSHSEHKLNKCFIVGLDLDAVQFEEGNGTHRTGTFVTIDKRMVHDNMKQIGPRHLVNILMSKLSSKRSFWHGDSRFQQPFITNPSTATIMLDLIGMNRQSNRHGSPGR